MNARCPIAIAFLACSIVCVFANVSSAIVLSLTPSGDDMIYVNAPTQTGDSFSGAGNLDLYNDGTPAQRDLAQFNLNSIAGTIVTSATFTVTSRLNTQRNNFSFAIVRMTTAWDQSGMASWNYNTQNAPISPTVHTSWTTPGGDYANTLGAQAFTSPYSALNNITYGGIAPVTFDVTSLAQGWVSGAFSNDGLMLIQTDNPGSQSFFYSSDAVNDPSLWPTLTVTFVPEPASMATIALAFAGLGMRRVVRR